MDYMNFKSVSGALSLEKIRKTGSKIFGKRFLTEAHTKQGLNTEMISIAVLCTLAFYNFVMMPVLSV